VSRSSMNVASVTVIAINHGLMPTLGRERFREAVGVSVSLMNVLAVLDAKRDRSVSIMV
jgi:hypothetical protein